MTDSSRHPLLVDIEGHVECLLGNEAIVRGALESGVAYATGYPGTPSSEVTDTFAEIARETGLAFDYGVNEKIAIETAFAASLAGARSICAMKHLGLMYGGDPLSTIPYVGTVGGMVIVSAGDPSCRTSPNEQDQRLLAPMLHFPVLDPSTPQEAHAMTCFAFKLSEQSKLPVVLRPTTRVCHSRAPVVYGRLRKGEVKGFVRDPKRLVPMPANARNLRIELKQRVEIARKLIESSGFFQVSGSGPLGILASGAPAAACADLLLEQGLTDRVKLMVLGAVYPLPEQKLLEAFADVERLLIVEELSPYLEDAVRSLIAAAGRRIEVLGKRTGHFPVEFEYDPSIIQRALHNGLELGSAPVAVPAQEPVPPRPPSLCPGCPHRSSQFALRTVFGEDTLYFNDIGCYTLGFGPPINTADALLCMGAGFTLATGVAKLTGKRTVGIMGDSTFFHSGLPALLHAVKEDANMVAVILDNHVTAMTGFQESPTVLIESEKPVRSTSIEAVVRALGVSHVERVDPYDLPATLMAFERARDRKGVSVVIAERTCPVHLARETNTPYKIATYAVDLARCQTCGREAGGRRCGLKANEPVLRHMVRSRALECDSSRKSTEGKAVACQEQPAVASCAQSCPVGLCIQGFIGYIAAGDYRKAYEQILNDLPLPDSVCRVCFRPCERSCVRAGLDQPVAINDLKRFVMDWAASQKLPYTPARDPFSGKRVAVIGAGPSGLAAAHDLVIRGHSVSLFDAEEEPGGTLRTGIPAYRLPREALERDLARILALEVDFIGRSVLGRELSLPDLLAKGFDAVYVAVGAQKPTTQGIPGEGGPGTPVIGDALSYLKDANLGQRTITGQKVVVVGGGNAAIDTARAALRLGAKQVTIAYRRRREEMPAYAEEIHAAEAEGVTIRAQLQPARVGPGVLVCVKTRPGEPDASGRSRPVAQEGQEVALEADQILLAIGQAVDAGTLADPALRIECEADGAIRVDRDTLRTSHPKIFAGGDAVDAERTVIDAIAMGRRAAWGIDRLLRGQEQADRRPPPPHPAKNPAAPVPQRVDRLPRQRPAELAVADRAGGFGEVVGALSESAARLEASRCSVCGLCGNCRSCLDLFGCPAFFVENDRIHIDPELCMGCGVCAALCPNRAIHEVKE